ncbi:MAG TPA: efflux RND transporter permease subunit [bacterium]|nr:efflux RND transporter permease subunit [bacterium]
MFLSNVSISRPVFAAMLLIALVVLGLFSFAGLKIDQFPRVEWGVVGVSTVYPGASPETVERTVTRPVEEALNTIQGIDTLTSTSMPGYSIVIVQFELGQDINARTQDVRDKMAAIRGTLPDDAKEPVIQSFKEGEEPIVSLALASTAMDPEDLTTYAEDVIKRRLESVSGVGSVQVVGGQTRQVRITVDPVRLAGFGLGIDAVANAVRGANLEVSAGTLEGPALERDLTVTGRLTNPRDFARIVVGRQGGQPVFLSQVATIEDAGARRQSSAFLDGVPTVGISAVKVTDANTVEVAEEILSRVEQLKKTLPAGTSLEVTRNNSEIIRESIAEVKETLVIGAALTILVVFLFLGSWRSTIITGLTLPISIISSFIVFKALGFTFNVLSSMALTISVGLLIDDAIVVRENIVRHLAMGKDPIRAAREGTQEIGLAVLATTLTIVAVFIPVAFMGGVIGKYFYEFGIVVSFAVLVSLLVSFTLDPMLSSVWHDPAVAREVAIHRGEPVPRRRGLGVFLDWFHDGLDFLARKYHGAIGWSLRYPWAVHLVAVGTLVLTVVLAKQVGFGFFPDLDQAEFNVTVEAPESSSLAYTEGKLLEVDQVIAGYPEVEFRYGTVAGDRTTGKNRGSILVNLVDKEDRDRSQKEIMAAMRRDLAAIPGVLIAVAAQGGGGGGAAVAVSLVGNNLEDLRAAAAQVQAAMGTTPGLVDIRSSYKAARRSLDVDIDRQRASWYDINLAQTAANLRAFLGEDPVSTWEDANGEEHDVVLALPERWREEPSMLGQLPVTGYVDGMTQLVPLAQLGTVRSDLGSSQIERRNLQQVITLSAGVEGRDVGGANAEFRGKLRALNLPESVSFQDSGEGEQIAETGKYAGQSMLLAIIFIYLILASQFNSFFHPFAIMSSLPLALIGVVLGLLAFGSTLNLMSMIGLIMLMGLVTKNAILLVDYTNVLRARGHTRTEALQMAGETRLRPILMTTLAMIAGMSPLALALGSASEFRAPMAQAVMGGVATSALLTLFVVPVAYVFWDSAGAFFRRLFRVPTAEQLHHSHFAPVAQETPAE